MPIRRFAMVALGALSLFFAAETVRSEEAAPASEQTVRDFVAAFNARDLDRMMALVDDQIEWSSIEAASLAVETSGREALRAYMVGYFASCPSCRSALEWTEVAGSRVAAFERASWTGKDGNARSQTSLSVYELRDGKIARVYYFPSER